MECRKVLRVRGKERYEHLVRRRAGSRFLRSRRRPPFLYKVGFMGARDTINGVINRGVENGERGEAWGGVVGGILLLPRIAFNAAVFQSVTTSLWATEAITMATQNVRVFAIECVFMSASSGEKLRRG